MSSPTTGSVSATSLPSFSSATLGFSYQPVFETRHTTKNEVASATPPLRIAYHEVLVRPSRNGKPIAVGPFISKIERSKARAIAFDVVVLKHALGMHHAPRLGVNVSGWTASSPEGFQKISRILTKNPQRAHRLIVEITETKPLTNEVQTGRFIEMLKSRGCTVALDDFGAPGTGKHLNAGMVERLHPDIVKLDRNMVTDGRHRRPLLSAVRRFKSLGISTVAEGAKDQNAIKWLMKVAGADMLQCFALGMPVGNPRVKPSPAMAKHSSRHMKKPAPRL